MADGERRLYRTMSVMCRLPGMTFEEFDEHWRTKHAEMVKTIPGITRYIQRHIVRKDGEGDNEFGIDGFAILEYESREAFEAAWASEEGREAMADVANFRGRGMLVEFEDLVIFDRTGE